MVEQLREKIFPVVDRKLPLDCPPVHQLPKWGHWLETPDLIAALLTPGQLEVNVVAPFTFISTRFQPGQGLSAFDSDKLSPYRSQPGGFDVVPQGSSYRSKETAGVCIILAYKQPIADRIMTQGCFIVERGKLAQTDWQAAAWQWQLNRSLSVLPG